MSGGRRQLKGTKESLQGENFRVLGGFHMGMGFGHFPNWDFVVSPIGCSKVKQQ